MQRTLTILAALGVVACQPPRRDTPTLPSARTLAPMHGTATCNLRGLTQLGGAQVHADATGTAALAALPGARLLIAVEAVASGPPARARVVIRSPETGPALVARGWIDTSDLPLYAARDLPIVDGYVHIPSGTPIRVVGGAGALTRVQPAYGDFVPLAVDTSCDALAIERSPSAPAASPEPAANERWVHSRSRTLTLFSEAGGQPVADLALRRDDVTLIASASRGGMTRVRYRDGVQLDGWVRDDALAAGEGADCDDCHGWPMDLPDFCPCAESTESTDGCPQLASRTASAASTAIVRTRPDRAAPIAGELEPGLPICAREARGAFTRIVGPGGIESTAAGLWVETSALLDAR